MHLGTYSPCLHPPLPEGATWPGPAAPAARASQLAGKGYGCQPELGSGFPCREHSLRAYQDSHTFTQRSPHSELRILAQVWGYPPSRDAAPEALGICQGQVELKEP